MIISRMDGGLGNQMFQYAYGLYLARRGQTRLWLDTSSYRHQHEHGYLLNRFQIQAEVLPSSLLCRVPRRYRFEKPGLLSRLADQFGIGGNLPVYKQRGFGFDKQYLVGPDTAYVVGYWQSQEFFPGLREELLQHFRPRQSPNLRSQQVAEQMRSCNSICIHLRRGDYLNAQNQKIYATVDMDHYRRCIDDWAQSRRDVEVFVFSNDIGWCKEHLKLPFPIRWIDHNQGGSAHEDLWLMSQAACCVIANSTFSWWAAWLNEREDRVIYAPSAWFRPGVLDEQHLIPADWHRMPHHSSELAA